MEQPVARKPFAHGIGEAGQLDAARAHDADAAKLEPFGKVEDGLAIDQCRMRALGRERRDADRARTHDPGR